MLWLNKSRIVFLVGSQARSKKISDLLVKISENFNIPVATTVSAKGVFPEDHRNSLGCFGYMGNKRAIDLLTSSNVDFIVRLGFDFTQWNTLAWDKTFLNHEFASVHQNVDLLDKYTQCKHPIFSSISAFFKHFLNHTDSLLKKNYARDLWLKDILATPKHYDIANTKLDTHNEKIHPAYVVTKLRKLFPRETVIFVDSGTHRAFTGHYWESYGPYDYFSTTTIGPMGWAIPSSIGAKLAQPEKPMLVITGDGCMLMHGIEIQTAAKYNIDITYVVINNSYYGQTYFNNVNNLEELSDLPDHNFKLFAESLGLIAFRVEKPRDVEKVIETALNIKGPKLIEIICDHSYQTPIYPYKEALARLNEEN
jgi:acetolactate synthase-1/2/3 large subunit